jgi:AraC-like DNA-binding protein
MWTRRGEALQVADVACFTGMSESSLYRRFRAEFGVGPARLLCLIRMEEARSLLLNTHMPVHLVARKVGLSLPALARGFRNRFGRTPSAVSSGAERDRK